MRKFFCLSAGLAACSVAGLANAGGPQPQRLDQGIEVTPIRMAGINREGKLTTPWFYTEDVGIDTNCKDELIFDSFEPGDPDGGAPVGGEECNPNFQPSTRWYFGPTYCNTWSLNDIDTLADGAQTTPSDHYEVGWFWGDGTTGSEQCYLATFTYEDVNIDCDPNAPAASNGYDGIVLDFGNLAYGTGYYYSNITLCDNGLELTVPSDGQGGYDLHMWNFFDGSNFEYATCGQPMLWGQKDTSLQGSSTPVQWDDDTDIDENGNCTSDVGGNCLNLPDGNLQTPFECYDYAYGECPDPWGSMLCFYGDKGPGSCLTLDNTGLIGGLQTTWTVGNGTPNARFALVYGTRDGQTLVKNVQGYCANFGIRGVTTKTLICQKRFDANGEGQCSQFIPVGYVGRRVLTQAAEQGTCPEACMSNLLDQIVQ